MFAKVNLKNTHDFNFDPEQIDQTKFRTAYDRSFRPITKEIGNLTIYLSGTLVGRLENDSLRKTDLDFIAAKYNEGKIEEIIAALEGLYFLYLYDSQAGRHILINNRYQLTTLYYAVEGDYLLFSDRLTVLLPHLSKVEPHFPSIANFLANGFNSSDQTQIKSVKKLLPTFWIDISRKGVIFNNNWKDQLQFDRQPFDSLESHLDKYEKTYSGTLSNYLSERKPDQLATLLSGGHDTSFVMIQSSKVFNKPVNAFTTVFPDWNFNEQSYAENICNKFGGKFHPIPFETTHLDHIVDLISACEEPVLGSTLPLHILAKKASEITDTILGGDGGDTMWGEYYPVGEYHRWIKNLPLAARKLMHSVSKGLRDLTDWERFWELEHVAGLFVDQNCYYRFMNRLCTYRHFSDDILKEMLNANHFNGSFQPSMYEIQFNRNNFDDALIEGKLFNAFYTYQSFQQTRSMNSFGMEFYLPTINSQLMRFITNLPKEWVNAGTTFHRLSNNKSINRLFHKKALSRYLAKEEIYNRSFDIPWYKILKPRPQLVEKLKQKLINRGWYNPSYINKLFDEFLSQKNKTNEILELKSHGYRILALMSLEVWAIQFIDHKNQVGFDPQNKLEDYF